MKTKPAKKKLSKKKYNKPLRLDMSFDEAMNKLAKAKHETKKKC